MSKNNNNNENIDLMEEEELENDDIQNDPHLGQPNYFPAPEKEKTKFQNMFLSNGSRYIVSIIISAIIFLLIAGTNGFQYLESYVNASFVTAIVNLAFAGLSVSNNEGTFDSLGYGFYRVFVSYRINNPKGKYNDLYDYKMVHDKKRKENKYKFIPYLMVGVLFLIASLILFAIFQSYLAKNL